MKDRWVASPLRLAIKLRSGPNVQIVTDGSWVGTGQETARWEQSDFDDSAWKPVAVQGKMGMNRGLPLWDGARSTR